MAALILACVIASEVLQSPHRAGPGLLKRQFPICKATGALSCDSGCPAGNRAVASTHPYQHQERGEVTHCSPHTPQMSYINHLCKVNFCLFPQPSSLHAGLATVSTNTRSCSLLTPGGYSLIHTEGNCSSASPSAFLLLTSCYLTFSLTSLQNLSTFLWDTPRITTQSPAELLTEPAMPVPDLPVLQHLARVSVQMGGGDVFQGVVLEGRWGGVELPTRVQHWDAECWAVPGRGADGAHTLGRRLRRQRLSLKAAVIPSVTTPRDTGFR